MSLNLPTGEKLDVRGGSFLQSFTAFLADKTDTSLPKRFVFDDLNFEMGTATLTPPSQATVDQLASVLKAYPGVRVTLEGHTEITAVAVTADGRWAVCGSYDRTLKVGPYNYGFSTTRPDWVEHYPYQNGLLIWKWDTSQQDNNTGDHAGTGLILPIAWEPLVTPCSLMFRSAPRCSSPWTATSTPPLRTCRPRSRSPAGSFLPTWPSPRPTAR